MRSLQLVRCTLLTQTLCLVLLTSFVGACGSDKESPKPAPARTVNRSASISTSAAVTFTAVAPIIAANCAGSGCHSSGSGLNNYVGNQANVDENKANIYSAVSSGYMPPRGGLSNADKATLLQYTNQ